MGAKAKESIKQTIECHCTHDAHLYRKRTFINAIGYTVIRGYYRCENCASRIQDDNIQFPDDVEIVSVFDLMDKIKSDGEQTT